MAAAQQEGKRVLPQEKVGFRRRLLLFSVLLCSGVLAALSLGALAQSRQAGPAQAAPVWQTEPPALEAVQPTLAPVEETDPPIPLYDFTQPAPEAPAVEDDYFSDAVFLGDSRSDGLRLYSGIRGADFLAYKSLMVFQVTGTCGLDRKAIPMNGKGDKKTVLDFLEEKQYAKVYIMFGVNELGFRDDVGFQTSFGQLIDEVRQRQPDAVIYIQSLIQVNPEKAKKTNPAAWLNNEKVAEYNDYLRQVAQDKQAVYIDVEAALVGENGDLPPEGTTDGIHFTKSYYKLWYEYLKTHTVDADLYAQSVAAAEKETSE